MLYELKNAFDRKIELINRSHQEEVRMLTAKLNYYENKGLADKQLVMVS